MVHKECRRFFQVAVGLSQGAMGMGRLEAHRHETGHALVGLHAAYDRPVGGSPGPTGGGRGWQGRVVPQMETYHTFTPKSQISKVDRDAALPLRAPREGAGAWVRW